MQFILSFQTLNIKYVTSERHTTNKYILYSFYTLYVIKFIISIWLEQLFES